METDVAAQRVTLARVAEEAGVSLSTISKVLERPVGCLGGDPRCGSRLLLAERGYVRRGGRSESHAELIELVFHELDPIWSMELIDGVESVAKANGLSVVLTVSGSRHAPDPDWIEGVMRRRPVGIVLVFSELAPESRERAAVAGDPFVIVDRRRPVAGCPVRRLGELVGRPRGHPPPHRAGASPHRGDHHS